ncbi:hypothetical protein [Corynebacterium flavescens]|uniref:hypothetical protein n=1 Tax=Corynebacterium flavescens TaxID=28028 RepID=UPI003FD0A395
MTPPRLRTYFALANYTNRLVGTAWSITQRTGDENDFFITPFFSNPNGTRELQTLYLSIHLPGKLHTGTRFHFQLKEKELNKLKKLGYASATDLDTAEKHIFPGEETSSGALLVARFSWSYLLQFPKYAHAAINAANLPEIVVPDSGVFLEEKLPPNSYWVLDLYLTKGKPYSQPGSAWGFATSGNEHSAFKSFEVTCNGEAYYLTTVSKLACMLVRPLPYELNCPPAPVDQASRIFRITFKDGLFPWIHETITARSFRDGIVRSLNTGS